MSERTPQTTFYRGQRISDMSREELMDALVDVAARAQETFEQRQRDWDQMRQIKNHNRPA